MIDAIICLDAVFGAFGQEATFIPQSGVPVTVRVILKRGDSVLDFGATRVISDAVYFEMRRTDDVTPQKGDRLEIGDRTYLIQAEPRMDDVKALIWILDTRLI